MKKTVRTFLLLLSVCLLLAIVSCNTEGQKAYTAYTVTFESNGGTPVLPVKSSQSTGKIEKPADPEKDGYTFGGWYGDRELKKVFIFENVIEENTTLYAKWKKNYAVSFVTSGGSDIESYDTATISNPPHSARMFYSLKNWYTDPSFEAAFRVTFPYEVTADTVFYAEWTLNDNTDDLQFIKQGNYYYVSGLTGNGGSIVIPSSLDNARVAGIDANAFKGTEKLTDILIPSAVADIGADAFLDCYKLKNVVIEGENLKSIGARAFSGCIELESISIPGSVTSIGEYAFYNCQSITGALDLPDGLVNIEKYAFYDCASFTGNITIPAAVTGIGEAAFYNCSGLTGNIVFPQGLISIGAGAFARCGGLSEIEIPASISDIGNQAFLDCGNLEAINVNAANVNYSSINGVLQSKDNTVLIAYPAAKLGDYIIPDSIRTINEFAFSGCVALSGITFGSGITEIGGSAFFNCSALTDVVIPQGVISVGSYAFSGCVGLESVSIGRGVKIIGDSAFSGCTDLTGITISRAVESIGSRAFKDCNSLVSINVNLYNSNYTSIDGVLFSKSGKTLYVYPAGKSGAYEVRNDVNIIFDYAFENCKGLSAITFSGNSLDLIGKNAFSGCTGLTAVSLPDSLSTVSDGVFDGCSNITVISLPENLISIGHHAFSNCALLVTIILPQTLSSIGNYAFNHCKSLRSITIPSSVNSLGYFAFSFCDNLTINIPAQIPSNWDINWNPDNRPVIVIG